MEHAILLMTITKAAKILGVSPDADKQKINTAYRELVAKYHPDANRKKPQAEQEKAAEMFKEATAARKVLMDPSTADPEPEPEPYMDDVYTESTSPQPAPRTSAGGTRRTRTSAGTRSTQSKSAASGAGDVDPRSGSQTYKRSAASSQYTPGYNKAKTFNDNIPKVPDPAEDSYADICRSEIRNAYHKATDIFRVTPSMAVSLVFIVFAAVLALQGTSSPFEIFGKGFFESPLMATIVAMGMKFLIYDMMISYYVHRALMKKDWGWLFQVGIEAMISAVICAATASMGTGTPEIFGIGCLAGGVVGAGLTAAGVLRRANGDKKATA